MRTETEALLDIANAKIQDLQSRLAESALKNAEIRQKNINLQYQLAAKDALLDEAGKALGKIGSVNQMRPELGQLIESEHYEAAWLDCVGIAQESFAKIQEARRG